MCDMANAFRRGLIRRYCTSRCCVRRSSGGEPQGAGAETKRRRPWTSPFPPRSRITAAACAPSSRRRSCRSKPIPPATTRMRTSPRLRCSAPARRRRRPGCGALHAEGARRPGPAMVGMAVCYEAMNRSIFGPVVFNSAAPDDGNMMVLEKVGTPAQKERWLQPIVDGKVRSAFAMTEPQPGGGSDPSMIADPRREARRPLCRPRAQVVHHRRRGGAAFHPARAHLRGSAPRADGLPVPPRPARLEDRPAHPDHGAGGAWRPLRAGLRRARDPGRERAVRRGRRAEGDADPPRAGAPDPLHALARAVEALRRDRRRLCARAPGLRRRLADRESVQ